MSSGSASTPEQTREMRSRAKETALRLSTSAPTPWAGPFHFVQMADPQFGMLCEDREWTRERKMVELAVQKINAMRPPPKFVVVCGDLVNRDPFGANSDAIELDEINPRQVDTFNEVVGLIDEAIPLVCTCGNHDVGTRPSARSVQYYRDTFGPDHYAFSMGGCLFVVLNSQLHWQGFDERATLSADVQALAARQLAFFRESLASSRNTQRHKVVFSHVPPFLFDPDESTGYFNIEPQMRQTLLDACSEGSVSLWMSGHYHRNARGCYRYLPAAKPEAKDTKAATTEKTGGAPSASSASHLTVCPPSPPAVTHLECVTTSAVGTALFDKPQPPLDGDSTKLLGLAGCVFPDAKNVEANCNPEVSGLRLVWVGEERIQHRWFPLSHVPVDVLSALEKHNSETTDGVKDGDGGSTATKRVKRAP